MFAESYPEIKLLKVKVFVHLFQKVVGLGKAQGLKKGSGLKSRELDLAGFNLLPFSVVSFGLRISRIGCKIKYQQAASSEVGQNVVLKNTLYFLIINAEVL